MSDDFQAEALKERDEWLTAMGATEEMVHEDPTSGLEFIFLLLDGTDALTRSWLPFSVQTKTIYSPVIKVKN